MKKLGIFLFLLLLAGAAVFWIRFFGAEDGWICVNESWVKHGNPSTPAPETGCGQPKKAITPLSPETTSSPAVINPNPSVVVPYQTSLSGLYLCLPSRGTGPTTMECALGLKTSDDKYYALDTSGLKDYLIYPTGTNLRVYGLLTPIEMISSDHWQKYDIKGIMKVDRAEELDQ